MPPVWTPGRLFCPPLRLPFDASGRSELKCADLNRYTFSLLNLEDKVNPSMSANFICKVLKLKFALLSSTSVYFLGLTLVENDLILERKPI